MQRKTALPVVGRDWRGSDSMGGQRKGYRSTGCSRKRAKFGRARDGPDETSTHLCGSMHRHAFEFSLLSLDVAPVFPHKIRCIGRAVDLKIPITWALYLGNLTRGAQPQTRRAPQGQAGTLVGTVPLQSG